MTTTTLKDYTFDSVAEHLGEMAEHIATQTQGKVRIVSVIISKEDDSGYSQIGVAATGHSALIYAHLKAAARSAKRQVEEGK